MKRVLILVLLLHAVAGRLEGQIIFKNQPGWVGAVAFSPDGKTLAIGTGDGQIGLWDVATRRSLTSIRRHEDAVTALAFRNDGKGFFSGGHDHRIVRHSLPAAGGGDVALNAHQGAVLALALTREGGRLFSGGIDRDIREWDTAAPKVTDTFENHTTWVNGLALDREETLLASASSDNTLRIRTIKERKETHVFKATEGEIRAVAFSPDRKLVAAGIRYGHVRVWDLETKKVVASFRPFTGETYAVAFTPDGKTLLAGGGDWKEPGAVRRWDVGSWKEGPAFKHTGEVLCLALSRDGTRLAAGGWDRTVIIWDLKK